MNVGTKSVLFGAHCFFLHPWFVARAWWKLYGFPWDPRLWVAFFVHDLGYLGKPNMDGPEGETHPLLGAALMGIWFDAMPAFLTGKKVHTDTWYRFTLYHSRYYAKQHREQPSRLCIADKLAIALTPAWLYLPMARATGEIKEYMAQAHYRVKGNEALSAEERRKVTSNNEAEWYRGVQDYMRRWVEEHKDGKVDTWTSSSKERATVNEHGVWQ